MNQRSNPSQVVHFRSLLPLVEYGFEVSIVAEIDSMYIEGPPGEPVTYILPTSGTLCCAEGVVVLPVYGEDWFQIYVYINLPIILVLTIMQTCTL